MEEEGRLSELCLEEGDVVRCCAPHPFHLNTEYVFCEKHPFLKDVKNVVVREGGFYYRKSSEEYFCVVKRAEKDLWE